MPRASALPSRRGDNLSETTLTNPGLADFIIPQDADGADYAAGYALGAAGEPDPWNANYATWWGWLHGAIDTGRLRRYAR